MKGVKKFYEKHKSKIQKTAWFIIGFVIGFYLCYILWFNGVF